MYRTFPSHTFANQLSREWDTLRRRPGELVRARSWRLRLDGGPLETVLDELVDLDQITAATEPGRCTEAADAVLCQLVTLARVDQLAGRVVIQRLLPGLVARSARYRDRADLIDPLEIVVGAAWIAIHRYDVDRRGRHVAASIISDATYQAFRQPLRRRAAHEHAAPPELFAVLPSRPGATPLERLAEVMLEAREHGVAATDLQLVRDLVRVGSANRLAAETGVTPRTIRNRRSRAVANIRVAVEAA